MLLKILSIIIFLQTPAEAAPTREAGRIQDVKGKVLRLSKGQSTSTVKNGDTLFEGDVIQSQVGAAAKIIYADKTEMTIGSDSKMVIEGKTDGIPGAQFLRGTTRIKVVPTPSDKPKFLLKTKSATMGVRGTDFQVVFKPTVQLTSVLTFEGNVAMAKNVEGLYDASKAVSILPGTFSAITPAQEIATQPVKISPAQLESLKSNIAGTVAAASTTQAQAPVLSPIPPGLNPKSVMASDSFATVSQTPGTGSAPEGSFDAATGKITPPAGGYIDLNTGVYLPPPPGSAYDPVTQVYTPPPNMGSFDPATGGYVPPAGFSLDAQKGFVATAALPPGTPPPPAPPAGNNPGAMFGGLNPQSFASGTMATALPPPGSGANMLGGTVGSFTPSANQYVASNANSYTQTAQQQFQQMNSPPPPPQNSSNYFDPLSGQPLFPSYDSGICQINCNPFNQPGAGNGGNSGATPPAGGGSGTTTNVTISIN